jgi:hypothetical protein
MQQHKISILPVALVLAIRISYQITQHVSDVTASSRGNDATFACDAVGGGSLQPPLLSHDSAAHHTRNDAIRPNHFGLCVNVHTGRRDDKSVSCEDDTALQEAPQQLRRECELPETG